LAWVHCIEAAVGHFTGASPQPAQGAAEPAGDSDPSAVLQARLHEILTSVVARLEQLADEVQERSP
jgi:hypothetical protein